MFGCFPECSFRIDRTFREVFTQPQFSVYALIHFNMNSWIRSIDYLSIDWIYRLDLSSLSLSRGEMGAEEASRHGGRDRKGRPDQFIRFKFRRRFCWSIRMHGGCIVFAWGARFVCHAKYLEPTGRTFLCESYPCSVNYRLCVLGGTTYLGVNLMHFCVFSGGGVNSPSRR